MKLRNKLITAFLALSLIPILSFSILVYLYFKDTMTASSRDKLIALASIQEERVNGILDKYLSKGLLVTSRTKLRDLIESYSQKEDVGKLYEIVRILKDASSSAQMQEISVLNTQGKIIASTEPSEVGKSYGADQLFLRGKESSSVVDITEDRKRGSSVIISGPFILKDRLIGVVLIKDSGREIAALAGDYTGMGESGETTLAKRDLNGDALYIVPVRFRSDAAMRLRIPKGDLSRTMHRALNGEERYLESALDYRGVEVSAATRYIPATGWGLTVEIDRAEVLRPLRYLYAVLIVTGLFLLTVVVAIAFYLSRRIMAPVTRLEIAAQGISLGDYSCRADVTTGDELAALALSFNKMAESLLRSRGELDRKIADKEMLEKELRKVGAYNRSLIEASLDPLVTISAEGKITDVNEATITVTGVPREQLIGTDFSDFFTEPERARAGYRQVFEKGFVTDYPLTIRHRDGRLVEVLYNASVYRDESGNVLGVFAAARDVTESRRVMREFEETKNFLNNILQSSTKYSIIGKDLNNTILSWNEGARLNYGYSEEEILGNNSAILHIPEDIESGAVDILLKTAYEKGLAEGEFRRIRKDGSRFDANVVVTRRNDASGKPIGYLLMSTDITEKKLSEERLRYASRYARSLIEASLDPLVTISTAGKISDVNAATELVTGCPRNRLIGTDFSDYFTEPEKAREGYETVFREGEVKDYPLEIRHRDGSITPVLYNASVYRDESGKVMGVFAAARTLDALLRVSEKKLRDITRAMGEGIIVMDDKGRLTFMNPEAERLLGWTEKEMLHRDIHSIIHRHEAGGAEDCPILRIVSTGEVYHSWDDFFIKRDGSRFPVSLISSPVFSDGEVAAIVTAFRDISDRKAMEQKIRSYTEALETSNKELEQFAYVASHDLQEPLRKVTSFAELLDRRYRGRLDEKADTYIHFVVDGAIRMNTLINDLLAYSRVTTRAKEFAPTDLSEVVSRVSRDLSMVIEESNTSLTSDPLPTVMADETQMGQIFQNLISNAIKFRGQDPPVIHVSAERISDLLSRRGGLPPYVAGRLKSIASGWAISVRDNGIGIEPRFFDRIFELFQRLHTQEEYPGTGIGLAVCKKVVERHGGVIWVESEPGKGSTFCFAIPDRGDYGREERG